MIDQDLIDRCESGLSVSSELQDHFKFIDSMTIDMAELLDNYKKLIESNAELHKEVAKLRGESEQMQNKE